MTETANHSQYRPPNPDSTIGFSELAVRLADLGRHFYSRGWALGTSGNFSAVINPDPLQLAITPSGVDKGLLQSEQILAIDSGGNVLAMGAAGDSPASSGRPSDETALHLAVVRLRGAMAVLHTHSVWSTVLSEAFAGNGGLAIEGYEMLKGLTGVTTHEHREWLPIIENSQNMTALAGSLERALQNHPHTHGILIRRHGLYTWGRDLAEANRHVEILEFLLEVMGRTRGVTSDKKSANGE